MEEKFSKKDRADLWLMYTVVPALLPYILAVIYDLTLGFTLFQALDKHFLELIMMVFAISAAILGAIIEPTQQINSVKRAKNVWISVICCLVCLAFYGFLYNPGKAKSQQVIIVLQLVFALISGLIIRYGYKFECTLDSDNCKYENEEISTI